MSNSHVAVGFPPLPPQDPKAVHTVVNFDIIGWDNVAGIESVNSILDLPSLWALLNAHIASYGIQYKLNGSTLTPDSTNSHITSIAAVNMYPDPSGKTYAIGYMSDGAGGYIFNGAPFPVKKDGAILNVNGEMYLNGGDRESFDCTKSDFGGITVMPCSVLRLRLCLTHYPDPEATVCGWAPLENNYWVIAQVDQAPYFVGQPLTVNINGNVFQSTTLLDGTEPNLQQAITEVNALAIAAFDSDPQNPGTTDISGNDNGNGTFYLDIEFVPVAVLDTAYIKANTQESQSLQPQ